MCHTHESPKTDGHTVPTSLPPLHVTSKTGMNECVAGIAGVLNQCLWMLDELGMSQSATHLSAAIEALPGQTAAPPVDLLDLLN